MPGPYELYLIRHAIAEGQGDAWPDDSKRPLSDRGISRMRKTARGLELLGVAFDVLLTSPLTRTKQTAEVVASVFDPRPPIVAVDSLAPGGNPQNVLADIEKQGKRTRVGLVGHEPSIGELAAKLAGLRRPLEFKKGAICRIDVETLSASGNGSLRWFATPRMLRALRQD